MVTLKQIFINVFMISLVTSVIICNMDFSSSQRFLFTNFTKTEAITVNPNSNFEIDLNGNPTTGYQWFLENYDQIDQDFIKPYGTIKEGTTNYYNATSYTSYQSIKKEVQPVVGSGGIFSFDFVSGGKQVKEIDLKFIYLRPFAPDDNPISFTVKVSMSTSFNYTPNDYYPGLYILSTNSSASSNCYFLGMNFVAWIFVILLGILA